MAKSKSFDIGTKVKDRFNDESGTITEKRTVQGYVEGGPSVPIKTYIVKSDADSINRIYFGGSNLLPGNDGPS